MGKFTTLKLSNGDQLDVQEPIMKHYLAALAQTINIKDKQLANMEISILVTISILHLNGEPITREYYESLPLRDIAIVHDTIDVALQPLKSYIKKL